ESESLVALADHGFRFSLDNVSDLRIEPRELAERGFRFIKVPAGILLGNTAAAASDIHPADLSGLLGRFGVELIADRIENETTVIEILDYDVRFGQGFLFSPPRPVRPEALLPASDRDGASPVISAPSEAAAPVATAATVAAEASAEPRGPAGSRALPKTKLARGATGTA
ncbi:MAG: EAL domain-containing protein, partial [Hyphomonadaceae bacterium]|nr:EAL domain-containing protein [Hyphomonadaceae bacterium]